MVISDFTSKNVEKYDFHQQNWFFKDVGSEKRVISPDGMVLRKWMKWCP